LARLQTLAMTNLHQAPFSEKAWRILATALMALYFQYRVSSKEA
jgi:hypothetical protein